MVSFSASDVDAGGVGRDLLAGRIIECVRVGGEQRILGRGATTALSAFSSFTALSALSPLAAFATFTPLGELDQALRWKVGVGCGRLRQTRLKA